MARLDSDTALIDFHRPDWYRTVAHLDMTMVDYLAKPDLSRQVRELLLAEAFALMGANENAYSVINLLHKIPGFGSGGAAFTGESRGSPAAPTASPGR